MGPGVDVAFDVVDQAGRGSLSQPSATESMLLGVKGVMPDTLVHVPGAESLECLQKVIGKGYRAVG